MAAGKKKRCNVQDKRPAARRLLEGTRLVKPAGVQARYGISYATRWRWERRGLLPPRDVFVGGVAIGWRPETLAAAEAGEAAP